MKITTTCKCGATFEVDDPATSVCVQAFREFLHIHTNCPERDNQENWDTCPDCGHCRYTPVKEKE